MSTAAHIQLHDPAPVRLGAIEVFGRTAQLDRKILLSRLEEIDPMSFEAQHNLLRYFSRLDESYLSSIRGRAFTSTAAGNAGELIKIDRELINRAFSMIGPKFFEDLTFFTNPAQLCSFVKASLIKAAHADSLTILEEEDCFRILATLELEYPIGRDGVIKIPLSKLPWTGMQEKVLVGNDRVVVNVWPGHPGVQTSSLSCVVALGKDSPSTLVTAYPGSLVQDFPAQGQSPQEFDSNCRFWLERALVR